METKIKLEMTVRQYAELREAVAYLGKRLLLDPALRRDCTLTTEELDRLLAAMGGQVSDIDMIRMLVAAGRAGGES